MEANSIINQLTELLLQKNNKLSTEKARTWVELLWSDFEATYAKAGHVYRGAEYTEKIVRQWIESYGDKIHQFASNNPKYAKFLKDEEDSLN